MIEPTIGLVGIYPGSDMALRSAGSAARMHSWQMSDDKQLLRSMRREVRL